MKKINKIEFENIYKNYLIWYDKYCSQPPYYDNSEECMKDYKILFNTFNKYTSITELDDLSLIQKKSMLTIQAYLFHYYKFLIYKNEDLMTEAINGYAILKNDIEDNILDKLYDCFEKGIKKIEQAKKINANDDFISRFFARTYRLIYSDKADYYKYIQNNEEAMDIYNYLIKCEEDNIIQFSIATRVNLIDILLNDDNPNIDLALKYYYEILNYSVKNLFNEHRVVVATKIYNYFKDNCEYEKALEIANEFENTINIKLIFDFEKNNLIKCIEEKNKIDSENTNNLENNLNKYFNDHVISKMSDDGKIMINTSINMYNTYIKDKDDLSGYMDYSIINISALKAVEDILYKIIGEKYLNYLHTLNNLNFNNIPNCFKIKNGNNFTLVNTVSFMEYGDAIHAMCRYYNNNYVVINTFKNFCLSSGISLEIINILPDFVSKLNDLRIRRNTNSHKNRVDYNYALECKEMLFDTLEIIKSLYEIFDNLL